MSALDQSGGAPLFGVLLDLIASGFSGLCIPPIVVGTIQLGVGIARPEALQAARSLSFCSAVVCTIWGLARAAGLPIGITTPASEVVLFAYSFVYGLMPALIASAFGAIEALISLARVLRANR